MSATNRSSEESRDFREIQRLTLKIEYEYSNLHIPFTLLMKYMTTPDKTIMKIDFKTNQYRCIYLFTTSGGLRTFSKLYQTTFSIVLSYSSCHKNPNLV